MAEHWEIVFTGLVITELNINSFATHKAEVFHLHKTKVMLFSRKNILTKLQKFLNRILRVIIRQIYSW